MSESDAPQTPEPIRVMNILARLNIGGPAIHVSLLTAKMCPPEYESVLVTGTIASEEGDMAYYAEERGVQPIYIPELSRNLHPIRDLVALWKLYRLMRQWQPHVVHTNTAKAGFVGRTAAWLARVPVIVHTFHGHVFHSYFGAFKTRLFLYLERFAARLSDTIITLTDSLRRELADQYHITRKSHITVLPLGLDLSPFTEVQRHHGAFREAWQIPPDAPLIGIVGRLVPVKNHALFLHTAALIREKRPNAHFVIVGDGETRPTLEALTAQLGLTDCVHFTGWQKVVAPIYGDMDVNVISSHNEGTPVSVIEALAASCPTVATAVGGLPDLLEGGALGCLTPPGDAQALAQAILNTLDNPPDMEQAKQAMVDRYGIDRLVRDMDSLYHGLLAKKGYRTTP